MDASRRAFLALAAAAPALALLPVDAAVAQTEASTSTASRPAEGTHGARLTNLSHLRFLLAEVPVATSATHTTFGIESRPTVLAPWTYADTDGAGGYRPVGGGTRDAATGHWTQGAYNADDIARAAIVFIRDWKATGDAQSRDEAKDVLRSLAYLQTTSGPNAGRVVLWQQEDGTLNPSAIPVELPDPSDSAESYWLARTVWAFGEGHAAFRRTDPEFAAFLRTRLHLCLDALARESLSRAGQWVISDGRNLPAWLIAGGADATAEAMLGLAAATEAGDARSKKALQSYGAAVAAMATDPAAGWPFGAVLPWTGSLGFWHAWGAAAPEALARAGALLRQRAWSAAAAADSGRFTPQVLASGGPHNAWAPLPAEAQIAYGAHGRVAGALQSAAKGGEGFRALAGLAAGWFFGANTAGIPVYDPATGVTFDGVETDGRVNRNSGAESTIHGLLTMLLLDANRDVAQIATSITGLTSFSGLRVLDAESARLSPGCVVERPDGGAWTGEGNLSGGSYVRVPTGESVEFDVTEAGGILHGLVWRQAADAGEAVWEVFHGSRKLWSTRTAAGATGDRGLTEADGMLVPQLLGGDLPDSAVTVRCTSRGDVRLDALIVQPRVVNAVYATKAGAAVLYASGARRDERVPALAAGTGRAYDADGRQRGQAVQGGKVRVRGGGFTITRG
ncbi:MULTISPECIES: hypothetical protein [unclassified Microbacterium]|uniref:hypothetical protein n=1 Tax=unclassified Microbacterium TaxID=2609290 RepID=UPI000EA8AC37|nr:MULTISPECIES: hypothetical protein [unclassified Microbacterium]MBT2483947.1 hypothetical protein [Microbacterium sp. ISL-108]RKN66915.1 hypothetical protein D7252_04465 [Microbacterium sp. CGR2]